MKKVKIKRKYVLLALVSLFFGYIGLRYDIKREWLDSEDIDHRIKNYKLKELKKQKKIIQSINIEFFYRKDISIPWEAHWVESTRRNIDRKLTPIMHVTFTDNTKADIPIQTSTEGPAFSRNMLKSDLYQKLLSRFPGVQSDHQDKLLETVLMFYPNDTLYQDTDLKEIVSFQFKDPIIQTDQTYYKYGTETQKSIFPIFFVQQKTQHATSDMTEFLEDAEKRENRNYVDWLNYLSAELDAHIDNYGYRLYYSDEFSNLPLNLMPTGNQLNMTITYTMVDYGDDDGVFYKAWSTSKTYTESNKDEYITEILIPNQNKRVGQKSVIR